MSLKISNQNGTFNVEGRLNAATALAFKTHMEYVFELNHELLINIDAVKEIDTTGLAVLKSLYLHALIKNKPFYILGNGCKDIYHDFRQSTAA